MGLRRQSGTQRVEELAGVGGGERRVLRALSIVTVDELHSAYLTSPDSIQKVLPKVDFKQMFGTVKLDAFLPGASPIPRKGFGGVPPPGASLPEVIPFQWFEDYMERAEQVRDFPAPSAPADSASPPAPGAVPSESGGPTRPLFPGAVGQVDPPAVNLIPRMQPIRNQGLRQTCTAHAVGALMEFHLGGTPFGPQYIYWKAKETDGSPNDSGTWIGNCVEQMVTGGAARELTWPYIPNEIPGNEGQGPPPPEATTEAPNHPLGSSVEVAPRTGQYGLASPLIMQRLATGAPVVVSVVSPPDLWQGDPQVFDTGIFTMPLPGTDAREAHSICAVGYGTDTDFAGGGYIIFRNSWGTEFYRNSPFAPGYGVLPVAYLDEWGLEAFAAGSAGT